jgi:hypothetical protein
MLRYVWKFALDILPSVLATIIGAYIVNHYIVTKPGADAPAAAVSTAEPNKVDLGNDAKPSEAAAVSGNIPETGVKARGVSEKTMLEKAAGEKSVAEKPAAVEKPALAEKPVVIEKPVAAKPIEKSAEKPAETANIPVETRRHHPGPREKPVAKSAGTPIQSSTSTVTVAPVVAAPNTAAPAEAAIAPEDRRDANELARAAIERLRNTSEPRAREAGRIPDAARVPETTGLASAPPMTAPVVSSPPVRPLPPPIMVSAPPTETLPPAVGPDPRRPTPPAEIPSGSQPQAPLDLSAEALQPQKREHTSVAEEMLLAAKSVFHSVLPK